jgi:hypothetical protein
VLLSVKLGWTMVASAWPDPLFMFPLADRQLARLLRRANVREREGYQGDHSRRSRRRWKSPAVSEETAPTSWRSGRTAQDDSLRALRRRALQVVPTARKHEKQTAHQQTNRRESQSARLRGGYRTGCDVQLNVIEI